MLLKKDKGKCDWAKKQGGGILTYTPGICRLKSKQ